MKTCIDKFEAYVDEKGHAQSEKGKKPSDEISWKSAKSACEKSGFRLCHHKEWVRACRGPKNSKFPYGNEYDASKCNTSGENTPMDSFRVHPAGSFPACKSPAGAFDMSGNLAEWLNEEADNADGRQELIGGSYASRGKYAECEPKKHREWISSTWRSQGFRCCADQN